MACNCNEEGKVINIGLGCCVPIVANADAYYTKSEIDEKIDDIVISGGGITSGEVQTMIDSSIADKADKSEIPTVPKNVSAFVNDVPYLTEHQPLTDYATKQWVEDKHYITGVDLSDYALKEEIPDISGYATEQWVNDQGFLKAHQSLEGYATENWVQSQGYLTQHQDLSDYALKSEIPDVNDKLDVSAFNTYSANTNTTINGKQDTLSAGSGISITNDEISTKIGNGLRYAQDGTLEVNSTNAIASGNTQVPLSYVVHNYINNNCVLKSKIWCGTASEYDAITTKDPNIIYLIHS